MKTLILILLLSASATCGAETWRCTDSAKHTYTSSQKVSSDSCVVVAKESPYKVTLAEEMAARRRDKKGGAIIGMSKDEVVASSWGKPVRVNRTTTGSGVHEQWVYDSKNLLYFDNGVLTAIQN